MTATAPTLHLLDLHSRPAPALDPAALPPEEQARRRRFHHAADQDRFLAGRLLARAALARHLGCAPADVRLVLSPAGRPEAAHQAAAPFSLAHSGRLVALAIGGARVGVDVEEAARLHDPIALAASVLTTTEREHLARATDTKACFLRYWTLKEAYTKALGEGLRIDPKTIGFTLANPPSLDPPDPTWHFAEYAPLPGYALALAWQGPAPPPAPQDGRALLQDYEPPRRTSSPFAGS
jgi:4'-phosphopantetheinyl transferase